MTDEAVWRHVTVHVGGFCCCSPLSSSVGAERFCSSVSVLHSQASPSAASVQKCPPAAVPNAKNVKQMLLDWCRAKTEPYEVNTERLGVNYCPLVAAKYIDCAGPLKIFFSLLTFVLITLLQSSK